MNIKKVILKEGLIIIAIGISLHFSGRVFFQNVPVVLPKYKAEFTNGSSYIITIYPDIAYSKVLSPKVFLKELYKPEPKLITKRINEFAKRANIDAKLQNTSCVNNWQLRLSEAYSYVLSLNLLVKTLFLYLALFCARFVFWALKSQKK